MLDAVFSNLSNFWINNPSRRSVPALLTCIFQSSLSLSFYPDVLHKHMRRLVQLEQFAFPELSILSTLLNFRTLVFNLRFSVLCGVCRQRKSRLECPATDTKFPFLCSFSNHSVLTIHSGWLNLCFSRALAAISAFQTGLAGRPSFINPGVLRK